MKKILALSLACVMAVGLLAGCGGNGDSGSTNESAGGESGTLTVSLASSPSKLDPIHYSGSYEGQIINQVCDRLVAYNDTLTEYAPSLATSWTISDDGVTYVFQIRQGVHFQNTEYAKGREMTAEDVAYSLNRSAQHSDNNRLAMLDKAEVTGDWEVTCTLKNPDASFLTALTDAGNSIVAKEEVEGWGEDFGYHLSGTGAFCMDKFELDEQAVLSANPDYWLGAPALQKLVFKFISDPNQAANALQTGAVDLATQLSGEAINTVQNAGNGIELLKTEALKINYVRFNAQKGPTADPLVRKALIEAVDLDAVRTALYQYDEVEAAYLPLPYGSWGYDASLESMVPSYDPEDAKALLEQAGYGDGFEITINVSNSEERKTLATMLQSYWQQIGVKANISVNEWGTFSDTVCSGNSDVYAMSWSWYPDPYFFLDKLFSSTETTAIGNGAGYVNEYVEQELSAARQTTDQEERKAHYGNAMKQIMQDYTGIYYANPYELTGINDRVQDFVPRADGQLFFITSDDGETITRNTSVTD